MFDVTTVIGQRMVNTLDWLDEADVETTVTCCNGKGDQVKKKCGGRITASCKDVFRKGGPNMCVIPLIMFFSGFFAEFDNAECSADLFRTTNIWTVENVCPAPKIWMPGTTCKHKVLPSLFRGKRQSTDEECEYNEEGTCTSQDISIDALYCHENELYTAEKIREGKNRLCCLEPKFKGNAKRLGGTKNFQTARDECCIQYRDRTKGVDALRQIGCPFEDPPV